MEQKRRVEISVLNTLFCLIVVLIHIMSYPVAAFSGDIVKYSLVMLPWRLCSFVVQGFIMLSGVKLFLNGKDKSPYIKYQKGRFFGVIVPYAICFAAYYLLIVVAYDYPVDARFILKEFFTGSLVCHLYFIPLLFQFDLLLPLWRTIVNKCSPKLIIPSAIVFSFVMEMFLPKILGTIFSGFEFLYNDRIFTTYLCYWLMGCYIGKYYDGFLDSLKKYFGIICAIFALSTVGMLVASFLAYNQLASIPYINIIHGIYVLSVCIFLYALSVKIPTEQWERRKWIFKIDKVSFYIYLYHMFAIIFSDWLLTRLGISAQWTSFIIRTAIAYGLTLPGCIIYRKFFNGRSIKKV